MNEIQEFLDGHRETMLGKAPKDARQHFADPNLWALKMTFHQFKEDRSLLSLVIELESRYNGTMKLDYRLLHETESGGALRSPTLVVGEFADLRNDLARQMASMGLDQSLADEPGAHLMFYYVEQLYWELADEVEFNARYAAHRIE